MLRDVWMIQDETLSGGDGETMRDSRVEVGKEEENKKGASWPRDLQRNGCGRVRRASEWVSERVES